jgi:hypothetical protein
MQLQCGEELLNNAYDINLGSTGRMAGEDTLITVNVTPDGYGDSVRGVVDENNIHQKMFVKPLEVSMTFGHFRDSSGDNLELKPYPVVSSELYHEDRQSNAYPHR